MPTPNVPTTSIEASRPPRWGWMAALLFALLLPRPSFAQNNGALMPYTPLQFFSASGAIASGAKLCSFAAGTTTPLATYSEQTLTTANSNPITLGATGRSANRIFIRAASYKFILYAAVAGQPNVCPYNGTTIWSMDNVYDFGQLISAGLVALPTLFVGSFATFPPVHSFLTYGLIVDQGTATNNIAEWRNDSIATGMTSLAETNTFGQFYMQDAVSGGFRLRGLSASPATRGVTVQGIAGTSNSLTTTSADAPVTFHSDVKSGTSSGPIPSGSNAYAYRNDTNTIYLIGATGEHWSNDGTAALPAYSYRSDKTTGWWRGGSGTTVYSGAGANLFEVGPLGGSAAIRFGSAQAIAWSSNADPTLAAGDTFIQRAGAGTVDILNGSTSILRSGPLSLNASLRLSGTVNPYIGWTAGGSASSDNGDTFIGRGGAGKFYFQNASGTANNEVALGDSSHVLSNISTSNITSAIYTTIGNCASPASPANCVSYVAGAVAIAAAGTSLTVNTTAVTANSVIVITEDSSVGSKLGVTCNTVTGRHYTVTARTASTSFTVVSDAAPAVNPACLNYWLVD